MKMMGDIIKKIINKKVHCSRRILFLTVITGANRLILTVFSDRVVNPM